VQVTFLGTSAGVPTRSRNVAGVALRLPQRAEIWLFDCGEGTQHQLLKTDLKISHITRIFITHMHGDHIFGLMGLLATAGMSGHAQRVDLYGPPGLERYVRDTARHSETHFSQSVDVHPIESGMVFEDDRFSVRCRPLDHRVPSFGYCVIEKDSPGHFNVEKAAEMGIPSGPLYGKLKRSERVILPDGREVSGEEFCGPTIRGRRIVYCTDTIYCENAVKLAQNADLLIHEATFARQDEELARQSLHSTTVMAARVAQEARVKKLVLTHFSPRYEGGSTMRINDLLGEARSIFPPTEMAHDLMRIEVARHNGKDAVG